MNLSKIIALLKSATKENINDLFDDEEVVFWVDWREEEENIVAACESVLQTGRLSSEFVDADNDLGYEFFVIYGEKRFKVPLTQSMDDRHIALCSLNDALAPDYEIRFCIDSNGADTLAFLPLTTEAWRTLEQQFGANLSQHFYKIAIKPNLFTDRLPF